MADTIRPIPLLLSTLALHQSPDVVLGVCGGYQSEDSLGISFSIRAPIDSFSSEGA